MASHLKKDANLRPCGTMGQMLREVQKLGVDFTYYQSVDIVEGRKLLVKVVDTMMREMNEDTQLRPYLGRYPVTPWNVETRIYLRNPDGSDVSPEAIQVLEAIDGSLCYIGGKPPNNRFFTAYQETYKEALERIADPSLPLAEFKPDQGMTPEETANLRKSIQFVSKDGTIYHLGENGGWVK